MAIRDLKERYGASLRTNQAFNRAIRAEIPGGSGVLDALGLVGGRASYEEIAECLTRAREEMARVVAARYDLVSSRGGENAEGGENE